ncbi:unnamed protein product [Rotaria sp. Silwood2]|nr:unnamed protein product [Rotaria sp. Silwood2]CAF4225131.1 unnamed protein product [Rotaria sp. Silwood2]
MNLFHAPLAKQNAVSITTSTSSTSTSATTMTTTTATTTTTCNSCTTSYSWNQTGVVLADTSSNPLSNPRCIVVEGNDTIYVCDHQIGYVEKWITNATSRTAATSNTADHMDYISFDNSGAMYTTQHLTNIVQRYPANSLVPTVVVGAGSSISGLNSPRATAVDDNYTLYINDQGNKRVAKLDQNGTSLVTVIDTTGIISSMSAILLKSSSSDQIYISDESGKAVFLWTFGAATPSVNLTDIDCGSNLNNPRGIRLDANGNLYVADQDNKRIVMFCANSTMGTVILSFSSQPMDLDLDSSLNLYVLLNNGKVYKHQLV